MEKYPAPVFVRFKSTTYMVSISEKTNAKNLENIHIVNATVGTIANYDPNNLLIVKTALAAFETEFSERMQAVNDAFSAEQTTIAAQTAAFDLVRPKVTKILKAVKGQGISPEALAHLMTTVRRLRGGRVSDKPPDNPETNGQNGSHAAHSVSRQSIAGLLEHLDLLDEQLKDLTGYKPNEAEYKPEAISAWIADLRLIRNQRLGAQAVTTDARHARDQYCYGPQGVIVRMNAVKAYVESILDKSDSRFKKIKSLKFVDNGK